VDFGYLESFTAGDRQVIAEVLALFRQQAEAWARSLNAADPGWRDHLKFEAGPLRAFPQKFREAERARSRAAPATSMNGGG